MSLFSERVTIRDRTVTGQDAYGNDVYGNVDRPDVPAWVEPRSSGEQTDARHQVNSGYWLMLEPGTPLAPTSQVSLTSLPGVDGWFEVDGDPGEQPGGFIVDGYVQVALKRVTG